MKKVAILFIGLVFAVSFANAANDENSNSESAVMTTSVSGKVLDKITGEALVGVKVSVGGTESVYTDFDGKFEIKGLRPGTLEITTSYISYKDKVEKVSINTQKSNNIDVLTYPQKFTLIYQGISYQNP